MNTPPRMEVWKAYKKLFALIRREEQLKWSTLTTLINEAAVKTQNPDFTFGRRSLQYFQSPKKYEGRTAKPGEFKRAFLHKWLSERLRKMRKLSEYSEHLRAIAPTPEDSQARPTKGVTIAAMPRNIESTSNQTDEALVRDISIWTRTDSKVLIRSKRDSNEYKVDEYTKLLGDSATKGGQAQILFVSTGRADFFVSWIRRLYSETQPPHEGPRPNLKGIVIKRLNYSLAERLERAGILAKKFAARIRDNIEQLREDPLIQSAGLTIEEREWQRIPPFHGYLCPNFALIGNWKSDTIGNFDVTTTLYILNKRRDLNGYNWIKGQFDA